MIDVDIVDDIAGAVLDSHFAGAGGGRGVGLHDKIASASGIADCGVAVGVGIRTACGECQIASGAADGKFFCRNTVLCNVQRIDRRAAAFVCRKLYGTAGFRSVRLHFNREGTSVCAGNGDIFRVAERDDICVVVTDGGA